jgi:4,5-dihydroxyphthalate decarboxylase
MKIRLALRDWDYVTPLLLGDVRAEGFDLQIDRVAALPDDFANDDRYDASELSLSRYALGRARGEPGVVGVPHFLMRGFRLRCILTSRNSGLTRVGQLAGKTIGLAGWQDSGNTWTRALLRREGIGIEDAQWRVSRLMASHPVIDRLGAYGRPGRIEAVGADTPLLELLERGEIDAVFMPFMPPGFFAPDSPFRQLVPDFRRAEIAYFNDVGYVPGMHLLGLKQAVADAHPWLPKALSFALDRSYRVWQERRLRHADTTPWLIDEMRRVAEDLPPHWDRNGFRANEKMVADFCAELAAQGLTDVPLTPARLFPGASAWDDES